MQIEFIGCTNAGKSTLARQVVATASAEGGRCVLGSSQVAGMLGMGKTKSKLRRALAIHAVAAVGCLLCICRRTRFVVFSFRVLRRMPIPRWQRWNQLRKVLKQLGCFEVLRRRKLGPAMVIVDEGTLHAAHNLFVHVGAALDERQIARFVELAPLPDVVVCVRDTEATLVERMLERWHPRIPRSATREVTSTFVHHALKTFDQISRHDRIAARTIVVDGREIVPPRDRADDPQIKLVTRILERALATETLEPTSESLMTPVG